MQTGLPVVGVGMRTLGVVTVLLVFGVILAYSLLVFGIVVVQGIVAFGQ